MASVEKNPTPSQPKQTKAQYIEWNHDPIRGVYTPVGELFFTKVVEPGYYFPFIDMAGLHLSKMNVKLDGLVNFDDGANKEIVNEIDAFWKAEKKFREINKSIKVLYKRGILMYGPPGCGKSSLIAMIMKDVVERNGIALAFNGSQPTTALIHAIRAIQPETKIVIVMEDIDGYIQQHGEEDLLNMLDGIDTVLDNVLFLATSNYANRLSPRLLRPSRFDLKIRLDYPSASLRRQYLEGLFSANGVTRTPNINRCVKDTEGFSFADLKELFISACVFGRKYENCVESLRNALHTEEGYGKKSSGLDLGAGYAMGPIRIEKSIGKTLGLKKQVHN